MRWCLLVCSLLVGVESRTGRLVVGLGKLETRETVGGKRKGEIG
jgi:hypothetical protein